MHNSIIIYYVCVHGAYNVIEKYRKDTLCGSDEHCDYNLKYYMLAKLNWYDFSTGN